MYEYLIYTHYAVDKYLDMFMLFLWHHYVTPFLLLISNRLYSQLSCYKYLFSITLLVNLLTSLWYWMCDNYLVLWMNCY